MERLFVLLLIDALGILLMSPLILLALVNSDDAFLSAAVLPLSIGRDCCAVPNAARGCRFHRDRRGALGQSRSRALRGPQTKGYLEPHAPQT